MLSKLKKISKDLIIYSALAADYEKPDFKNDALAGVRANYFNAKCSPQVEKTEITIDGKPHSLSYSMRQGEPMTWKVTRSREPVQTVKRASDGGYCIITYGENGVVFKRQFFNSSHAWLRTEYYSRFLSEQLDAVICPKRVDGLVILCLREFNGADEGTKELYPSLEAPKKHYAALVYSNSGMIWYDEEFRTDKKAEPSVETTSEEAEQSGFRFNMKAFRSGTPLDILDLKSAKYLSESDIQTVEEKPAEEPEPELDEPHEYSAYERIKEILFEAHKTNKSIFGELAGNRPEGETPEPDGSEISEREAVSVDNLKPEKEAATEEKQDKAPESEEIKKPEKPEKPEKIEKPEKAVEEPENDGAEEPEDAPEAMEEPEPDTVIKTKKGSYAYYGALDENNRRSGRGRTVTPDGLTAYEGRYADDKRDGFGVCYYKEGSPNYIGKWSNGNREGRGIGFRLSDGTMHAGKWSKNKPVGVGARFDKDGNFLDVCTYVNGKRNGKSVSFDEDGNLVVKRWKNGEAVSEKIISD